MWPIDPLYIELGTTLSSSEINEKEQSVQRRCKRQKSNRLSVVTHCGLWQHNSLNWNTHLLFSFKTGSQVTYTIALSCTEKNILEWSKKYLRMAPTNISFLDSTQELTNCKSYLVGKVHIFWEGHKILWNIHLTFVLCSASQK